MYKTFKAASIAANKELREEGSTVRFIYFNRTHRQYEVLSSRLGLPHLTFIEEIR